MRTHSKLPLATLTASALLAVAVSAATARNFRISPRVFEARWTNLAFRAEGITTINCPATLVGLFHSTIISKVSGLLVGYITSAFIRGGRGAGECSENGFEGRGTARFLPETLPWHIRYDRFIGALPAIREIRLQLIGLTFRIAPEGLGACLIRTTAARPLFILWQRELGFGFSTRWRAEELGRIPLVNEANCALTGTSSFSTTAEVFLFETTSRITVELVS